MKRFYSLFLLSFAVFSSHGNQLVVAEVFDGFADVYLQELGSVKGCSETDIDTFKVCSGALRNHGNAPYILHHKETTAKVFVLFHGLSDSPFYLLSIAQSLHQQGHNVVVGLLPGHGKKQADADMQDPLLSDRWRSHVSEVINIVQPLGDKLVLGGFSTGGVLVTEYSLRNPERVDGLLLFSGALALSSSVETFMNIWGIKAITPTNTLKWLDFLRVN